MFCNYVEPGSSVLFTSQFGIWMILKVNYNIVFSCDRKSMLKYIFIEIIVRMHLPHVPMNLISYVVVVKIILW